MKSIRRYRINKEACSKLSQEDKKILGILEEVVADAAKLYEKQLKDGFYPKGVDKVKLEAAGKKNPQILSPFTYVYQENSQLKAVPYHEKYALLLQPITEKIKKAAKISTNPSFKRYLNTRAQSLINGNYKEADIAWLDVKNSRVDFSVGPFERYLDELFFIKRIYQAHVGIIDENLTHIAEDIIEALYSSAKMSLHKGHSTDIPQKGVQILVENTPITSGYMAEVLFTGEHFPSDLDIMLRYGSKILIYRSQFELRFEKLQYPIFKLLFEKRFASKYSKDLLFRALAWTILLYEAGRQLHKFIGARERLKEFYGPIDEANAIVSGIYHSKYLVVKGLISQDELEAVMIAHIVRMFSNWLYNQQSIGLSRHVEGEAIALNTYLDRGGIKRERRNIMAEFF